MGLDGDSFSQLWVTQEFDHRQKAEGLAFWKSPEGRKFAVVFDNDEEDTGKGSYLLLTDSLFSVGPYPSPEKGAPSY